MPLCISSTEPTLSQLDLTPGETWGERWGYVRYQQEGGKLLGRTDSVNNTIVATKHYTHSLSFHVYNYIQCT